MKMAEGKNLEEEVNELLDSGKISPETAVKMLKANSRTSSTQQFPQEVIQTQPPREEKKGFKIWPWVLIGFGILGYFTYMHPHHLQNKKQIVDRVTPENINEKISSLLFSRVDGFNSRENLDLRYGHLEDNFAIFSPDTYQLTVPGDYTTVVCNVKSGRYWESTRLDLGKLENPRETIQWSAWKAGRFLIFGNKDKIKIEDVPGGIGVFPKGDFRFTNLSRSEEDIAYEKKADSLHEEAMRGEQIDPKYTTNSYGSRREWVAAGDLEVMVSDYRLARETNYSGKIFDGNRNTYKEKDDYKLYVNVQIRNLQDEKFTFPLKVISLSGVSETQQAEKPIGFEYIPGHAVVEEEYSFWVSQFSEEVVTLDIKKLEWWREGMWREHSGFAHINLEKLPKMEAGEYH